MNSALKEMVKKKSSFNLLYTNYEALIICHRFRLWNRDALQLGRIIKESRAFAIVCNEEIKVPQFKASIICLIIL